jgi:hypothetical protein
MQRQGRTSAPRTESTLQPPSIKDHPGVTRIAVVCITLAVLIAFSGALRNDFVGWDDDQNLIRNTRYQGLDGEHLRWMFTTGIAGHYQPLTWLSFALESQLLWGVNAAGFHFTNIVLHLATSVGFFFVARRIIEVKAESAENRSSRTPPSVETHSPAPLAPIDATLGALAAALLFAVHPLRVESVAWASERRDVLSGAWLMLTVLTYFRYVRQPSSWFWLMHSLPLKL